MIQRLMWLILLYAMLLSLPPAVSAAGCKLGIIYTHEPATIRAKPAADGAFVRDTMSGEALDIINVRRSNASCWMQTTQGWLLYNPLAMGETWLGEDRVMTGPGQPACLNAEMATTTGSMNIRQAPSTSSPVVASARAGDTFTIIQQTVSGKYCWLQVSQGWLAVTERVKAFRPNRFSDTGSSAPAATAPSGIDNCCFVDRQCATDQEWEAGYWAHQNGQCGAPPQITSVNLSMPHIAGSETFVNVVSESLNLMERKLPSLYQYIVSATSVIEEHGPDQCDWGWAYVGTGRTSLGSCLVDGPMPEPLYTVAAYLAHEACHHHGEDMVTGVFDHEPCYKAGHDAFAAMSA
ncbi:MAG: SH3 domain-containing protein [Chloroflexota bacterium]|nr:SH3 domain-containing protein [Chloroflexota bacterium]